MLQFVASKNYINNTLIFLALCFIAISRCVYSSSSSSGIKGVLSYSAVAQIGVNVMRYGK